jgi:ubiquinone/menaquinone biosynthesis C-methylase UbiE
MEGISWTDIYNHHPDIYDDMVSREDYLGLLYPALAAICPFKGARVVEFGAGTGRVTRLMLPHVRWVSAFDLSLAMLNVACQEISKMVKPDWSLCVADNRCIPVKAGCADIAIEGWSFLHLKVWNPNDWRRQLRAAIDEMSRVLRPGGMAVLIETLGTGESTPNPPENFNVVFEALETKWGFTSTWVRTDYCFASLNEARRLIPPFFGEAMMERVITTGDGVILPECTGIWQRKY